MFVVPIVLTFIFTQLLTKRGVLGETLHTHGLSRNHHDDGSISRFQGLGVVLHLLARTAINFLLQLSKLAGNVSSVTVQHRCIPSLDLTRVVQNDDLWTQRERIYVTQNTSLDGK